MKFNKRQKEDNLNYFKNTTVWNLEDIDGLEKEQLSPYQWRLWFKDKCIDIYPSSQKYFNLKEKEWGSYESLDDIIQ